MNAEQMGRRVSPNNSGRAGAGPLYEFAKRQREVCEAQRQARGEMLNIEDVLEILSMPLLGIIPESQEVLRASNIGSPVTVSGATSAPGRAYLHAARRLCGEALPMTIPTDRKGLLDKLFGRRAA
jgi:septum site-determining protein MinD